MTPSLPSLTTLRQGVSPALDTFVLRCLEKRPSDRWPAILAPRWRRQFRHQRSGVMPREVGFSPRLRIGMAI